MRIFYGLAVLVAPRVANFGTITAFLAWFGGTGYLLVHLRHIWVFAGLALSTLAGLAAASVVFVFVAKVLMANDPENFTTASTAPLLIIQGGADEQIPVVSTQILAKHECGLGQDLERWIYPGQSHSGVIAVSAADMIHWIGDRFAGGADPDPYVPTGEVAIERTRCPA